MIDNLTTPRITSLNRWLVFPGVLAGTSQYTRIGQEIEPLKLQVKMTLSLVSPTRIVQSLIPGEHPLGTQNSGPEDITAHVYIYFSKLYPDYNDWNVPGWPQHMDRFLVQAKQSPSSYAYVGTHANGKMIMNPDEFKGVHHFAIRLRKGAGYQSYSRMLSADAINNTGDPQQLEELSSTGQGSQYADLTFDIPCPKKLYFANSANSFPEHWCPYMSVGWSSNQYPMESGVDPQRAALACTSTVNFWYKDI